MYKDLLHLTLGELPLPQPPRLLDRVRHAIRVRHYSPRTEECYVEWATRFIRFHELRHPNTMGGPEIEMFLTDLAVNGHVAASTQNQAFCALLFLYQQVLGIAWGLWGLGTCRIVFRAILHGRLGVQVRPRLMGHSA